ncbi:MAG: histidine kinase [Rhizobacter sp.]|nr:histidine kinase [Ferruginibacter sp.]
MKAGNWLFILLLMILCVAETNAQPPVLYFKRLNRQNGLSNNKVNCILQDKRGFTWIGTDDGLNRYDGNNFYIFKNKPGDSSSLSGNTITDLYEDKKGTMWIATADGGITRYDHTLEPQKQFRQFKHHPGKINSIPVNIVNAIKEDKNGYLWLATSGAGVLKFDKVNETFTKPYGIGFWTIYDIAFDSNEMLWAGREAGSILKVNPQTLQLTIDGRYDNVYAKLPHVVVTRLFKDSKNNIWFGSWDKAVYRFNSADNQEESFSNNPADKFSFGDDEAISFNEDRQGRVWIGSKTSGLYVYDPLQHKFYNYTHNPSKEGTLGNNRINSIFIDKAGIVWLATNNGISIFNAAQQQMLQEFLPLENEIEPLVIYDFFKAGNSLWVGTSKGLYIKQPDGKYDHKKLSWNGVPLSITKFFKDDSGQLYIGTDYSLFRFNTATQNLELLENTGKDPVMSKIIESRVVSIAKDSIDGHPVLITVPYGHYFAYYDLTDKKWISRKDTVKQLLKRYDLSDNLIRKIVKTSDGNLWLANAKHGLIMLDKNGGGNTTFMNDPSLRASISNNNVFDIKEDGKTNLWISTYGGGLNYLDVKQKLFTHYNSVNNLVEGLSIDNKGNVWSISSGGLQKFNPVTKTFTYLATPDVEKAGGIKGNIYKDPQGKMYVAGDGYFIAFDPEQLQIDQQQPIVHFTDFSIFDESFSHLLMQKKIALNHRQNFFNIHFAAPSYTASAPVQYSYMLQGVDKDWVNAGTSTQAPYTNLSAGEYIFKVRATSTPGAWSSQVSTLKIIIIPPFWKKGWFFALLALLAAAVAYALYRYRINELLKRQAIRNKIAQDLHDSVGSTLSSISVYSQVAKIYNEQAKMEALTGTLEKISIASGEMISEISDTVWAINPRNDNMETILQRMESFARPLLASQEIRFHFNYDPSVKHTNLEMTKRKNLYLIFKEAVNNSLKYAACNNLWVSITQQKNELILLVKDDGKGFERNEPKENNSLSGNGLQNMQRRAKEMKGSCTIDAVPGVGTTITLQFPIP